MKYCCECGTKLIEKYLKNEGMIPYCEKCQEYRFPTFSSAVSVIILNPVQDKILLIKQYGKPHYVLVAGYINKKENALEALKREVLEEVSLNVDQIHFNSSRYFEPTNTCMFNFSCVADSESYVLNDEVDEAQWFDIDHALDQIKPHSLAANFLKNYLEHR